MPIYEYGCRSCGHTLEALQKISAKPMRKCPECGKSALQKLVSAPAFRLKGGGWYETDFKADGEQKRNLAESGEREKDASKAKDDGKAGEKKVTAPTASDTKKAKSATKSAGKRLGGSGFSRDGSEAA
jgi:putative FmdB family regulatory protein